MVSEGRECRALRSGERVRRGAGAWWQASLRLEAWPSRRGESRHAETPPPKMRESALRGHEASAGCPRSAVSVPAREPWPPAAPRVHTIRFEHAETPLADGDRPAPCGGVC